jgi:hypothetical protein
VRRIPSVDQGTTLFGVCASGYESLSHTCRGKPGRPCSLPGYHGCGGGVPRDSCGIKRIYGNGRSPSSPSVGSATTL